MIKLALLRDFKADRQQTVEPICRITHNLGTSQSLPIAMSEENLNWK